MDIIANMETNVEGGQTTPSDMFKEVEELMEDTQQKLEDAVHQVFALNTVELLFFTNESLSD